MATTTTPDIEFETNPWDEDILEIIPEPPPLASAPAIMPVEPAAAPIQENLFSPSVTKKISKNIFERALCVSVDITKPGNSRKVSPANIEVDSDKDMIRVSKVLLDSLTLREISALDGEIRQWLYRRCLPCGLLKSGIYLIPIPMVEEAERCLQAFGERRIVLVAKMMTEYESLVESSKNRLRSNFMPDDYPPAAQLQAMFTYSWNYIVMGTPQALGSISKQLYDRELAKAEAKMSEAAETVQSALRLAMQELVTRMVDRLGESEGGKKKIFRDSLLPKVNDFLDAFQARNLTDDDDMEKLVQQARNLLNGVEAKDLRGNETVRDSVRDGFAKIKTQLDSMLVDKPGREFGFNDGAEAE